MRCLEAWSKPICTYLALSLLFIVAWQDAPPLELTVEADPSAVAPGQSLNLTLTLTNVSGGPLEGVQVQVVIPEGTVLVEAKADGEQWAVRTPPRGERGTVYYRAMETVASEQSTQLGLVVTVLQETGGSIVLNDYGATADGVTAPVAGEALTIPVSVGPTLTPLTPSPQATATPTATPVTTPTATPLATATGTLPSPSATPSATPSSTPPASATPTPSLTAVPSATPSPTFTIVVAELPPTPTPNLTTEQERIGSFTVLSFVGFVLVVVVLSIVWLVRRGST